MESAAFQGLEPLILWEHFEKLTRIARPSKNEGAAIQFLAEWAKRKGFVAKQDDTGNLCVHVPANAGCACAFPVILQNHVDIVVARSPDAPETADPERGLIPVERGNVDKSGKGKAKEIFIPAPDGAWLRAPYTTLGADNGIGCAMAMNICEDESAIHPALELVFTVDEEQGLTGAARLNSEQLAIRGQTLINLDTEDDDELTFGCAGGMDTEILWSASRSGVVGKWSALEVALGELRGGHSGVEINVGRANSIRVISRLLSDAASTTAMHIASLDGGDKRNAIPRCCRATVFILREQESTFRQAIEVSRSLLAEQFAGRDNEIEVHIQLASTAPLDAFSAEDSARLLQLMLSLPAGVIAMTPQIPDLPETSNNLAIASTDGPRVAVVCNSRSSSAAGMEDVKTTIQSVCNLAGAKATETNRYPGWKPNLDSEILNTTADLYRRLFKSEPKIHAIHAGLECGILATKIPGELDSISFGPNIKGNHAPGERVEIASVQKSYSLLKALLAELASGH